MILRLLRMPSDPILKKIVFLALLVVATAVILVGESYLRQSWVQKCGKRYENQHAKRSLGRVMRIVLAQMEAAVQKLAAEEDVRGVTLLRGDIMSLIESAEDALTTLSHGGKYERSMRLNLSDTDIFCDTVVYSAENDDRLCVEAIELAPKMADLSGIVRRLADLVEKRIQAHDDRRREPVDNAIELCRKQAEATLLRATENVNKIYYDTSWRLLAIEEEYKTITQHASATQMTSAGVLVLICCAAAYATMRQAVRIIYDRKRALEDLRRHYEKLDDLVNERTSELRESEQHLQAILDNIGAGVMVVDADSHKIINVNRYALDMMGATDDQVLGHVCHDFICASLRGRCPITDGGKSIDNEEHKLTRIDGREIDVLKAVSMATLYGRKHLVESFIDITEKKRLETELRHAQKMESIGQLAAGIAHEINTPIQYVGDNIRFLGDSIIEVMRLVNDYKKIWNKQQNENATSEEELNRMAERVAELEEDADLPYLEFEIPKAISQGLEGVSRVSKIVLAMKGFSHPGAEGKVPTNINDAIDTTITVSRNEWKYVADMETDFDNSLPLVPCLAGEFNQVILNMIVNAAHAIADVVGKGECEKGIIKISTRRDGNWAEVRVADTGSGIAEEHRLRVFEHFFTTKDVGKGTGQGLSIAYSVITEKHNGTITFDTEVGKGTTFIIRMPIGAPDDPAEEDSLHAATHIVR